MSTELKDLEREDLEYRIYLLNHEGIASFVNSNEIFKIEKTLLWFAKISKVETRRDLVFMNNKKRVGMGGLTNISNLDKHCELYMYIDPEQQGEGLGYLFCKALCNFAFENLNLEKVFLYTFANNNRANKLYEKIGFKLEGKLRKHTFKDGKFEDRNIYGLLKSELK